MLFHGQMPCPPERLDLLFRQRCLAPTHYCTCSPTFTVTTLPIYPFIITTLTHPKNYSVVMRSTLESLSTHQPSIFDTNHLSFIILKQRLMELPFSAFQGLASHPAINDPIVSTTTTTTTTTIKSSTSSKVPDTLGELESIGVTKIAVRISKRMPSLWKVCVQDDRRKVTDSAEI